ncbi:lytic murein transglycosylase B [Paraglaciecola sp.]|uniref:lytic murein transglycosylase B n=1 Tax=Paraglaciecola sp. TaxID=1920173 RepID=UPI0030F40723
MYLRLFLLTVVTFLGSTQSNAEPLDEQQQFINMMVVKHHFSKVDLDKLFAQANKNDNILQSIAKPWEAKPWYQYHPIFLTEKRLSKGLEFWTKYKTELTKAEQQTGVPAQIIVAIIGVETFYGAYTGKYSVLGALTTLGFYYPPRAKFFRSELEHLLLLAREEHFDVTTLQGSYAGAMGWGQFIPSSYRAYAVDFDGDGVRDLLNNPVDAIGSVANYFKRHGWQQDQDVAYPVKVSGNKYQAHLSKELRLKDNWQTLKQSGVQLKNVNNPKQALLAASKVKLLELEQSDQSEYWVLLPNFYTITRYNHSPLYAMVIHQFSQQLEQAFSSHANTTSLSE